MKATEMGEYTGTLEMTKALCQVDTVDHFVKEKGLKGIGFVKIDVEGNEKAVLCGAANMLAEQKPLVYCELLRKHAKRFGYHPNDVINYMKDFGYRCGTIRNKKLEEVKKIDENTVETNFFFMHEQKHRDLLASF